MAIFLGPDAVMRGRVQCQERKPSPVTRTSRSVSRSVAAARAALIATSARPHRITTHLNLLNAFRPVSVR